MITYDRSGLSQPIKVFSTRTTDRYFMEKAESNRGWLFPMVEEYQKYGYHGEMQHFTDCLRRGVEPCLTFREGVEVNRIIDAAYASSRSGKTEKVS
jgi:predicted dehydrogenase